MERVVLRGTELRAHDEGRNATTLPHDASNAKRPSRTAILETLADHVDPVRGCFFSGRKMLGSDSCAQVFTFLGLHERPVAALVCQVWAAGIRNPLVWATLDLRGGQAHPAAQMPNI